MLARAGALATRLQRRGRRLGEDARKQAGRRAGRRGTGERSLLLCSGAPSPPRRRQLTRVQAAPRRQRRAHGGDQRVQHRRWLCNNSKLRLGHGRLSLPALWLTTNPLLSAAQSLLRLVHGSTGETPRPRSGGSFEQLYITRFDDELCVIRMPLGNWHHALAGCQSRTSLCNVTPANDLRCTHHMGTHPSRSRPSSLVIAVQPLSLSSHTRISRNPAQQHQPSMSSVELTVPR